MEPKENNKKLFIIVGVLLLFGGVSLAYFVSSVITGGEGGSTSVTTATIKGTEVKVEGILEFEDLDILPGHKSVSAIKITATGKNELIPYNLIWQGTNTLTTPLNFTVYKTSEQVNVTATCDKRTKIIGASKQLSEECSISNLDKLGEEVATGTINKNDTKVTLAKDEFITATSTGDKKYYYVILEYPNLDEEQNYDLEGSIDGEVTVEESDIKPDINILAAYVKQDDGSYKEVEDIPQSGYELNKEKSTCSNGTLPGWDIDNHRFYTDNLTKSGTSCYLYFDEDSLPKALAKLNITNYKTASPDFSKIADTDEGIFKVSDGMYGRYSYYWRGAVLNNHVIFANKCWRIVRINGDSSIRLIYNGTVLTGNTCAGNGANADSIAMNSAYNTSFTNSSYVGWTYKLGYQRPSATTEEGVEEKDSNAKTETESWFNTNITGANLEKVADGKFCNDRNTKNNETWRATGSTQYYAGYVRAYERVYDIKLPILDCPDGDVYTLKVGAITGDEVMYAGGTSGAGNNAYYIYSGQAYWTMSPSHLYSDAYVLDVNSNGALSNYKVAGKLGLRPVINIRSDVTFSSGNGLQDSPYIVAD